MSQKFGEFARSVKAIFSDRFSSKAEESNVKEAYKEHKLALYCLVISLFALLVKLGGHLVANGLWRQYLLSAKGNTSAAILIIWSSILSLEWITTPILSGLAMSVVTWYTVFLDSCIPGVFPPSPLSPKKARLHARTFHMGYYLAVINGLIITAVMIHSNLSHPSN